MICIIAAIAIFGLWHAIHKALKDDERSKQRYQQAQQQRYRIRR